MAADTKVQPSFSPRRRWSIGLNVFLVILVVLSVVLMVNYVSRDHFLRASASTRNKLELAPLTVKVVQSITNRVKISLFYDKEHEPLYSTVAELLNQYCLANPNISFQLVDYLRDPGLAQKVKAEYKLGAAIDKNLVIFDAGGKQFALNGSALVHYEYEPVPNGEPGEFRKRTWFEGEKNFTAALLAVTSPRPLLAYVLQGHGEHSIASIGENGYSKFAAVLLQNAIGAQTLSLLGTNTVPTNCDLLIVPGPTKPLFDLELEKIDQYLSQGGRLLVLLNSLSLDRETGLEKTGLDRLLAEWGVEVGHHIIQDPDNAVQGWDMKVTDFNKKHALVNPLLESGLYIFRPRSIGSRKLPAQAADAPQVDELAFTGPRAVASGILRPQAFPLMVAVEKGAIKNVIAQRGATRLVVVGDSLFLANGINQIESADNRAFIGFAVNWLLDRTQLLAGLPPKQLIQTKILMTKPQLQTAQLVLLGAMPGGVLLLGGLVWLRRRR